MTTPIEGRGVPAEPLDVKGRLARDGSPYPGTEVGSVQKRVFSWEDAPIVTVIVSRYHRPISVFSVDDSGRPAFALRATARHARAADE